MKKENLLKITDLRHELHMYPELSMQEKETAERIKRFLQDNTHFRIIDRGDWFYAFNDRFLEIAVDLFAALALNYEPHFWRR